MKFAPLYIMCAEKAELRRRVKELAALLSEEYCKESDAAAAERLFELEEYKKARSIFCYIGIGTEPDTCPIIERALFDGKTVALPRVYGKGLMSAHIIKSLSELRAGAFGIPEPPEESAIIEPEELDLIIVPAAAFDKNGNRLGKGGGYYDRFLSNTGVFTVGITRERILLDNVPVEEHDISVNCIITENKTARPR